MVFEERRVASGAVAVSGNPSTVRPDVESMDAVDEPTSVSACNQLPPVSNIILPVLLVQKSDDRIPIRGLRIPTEPATQDQQAMDFDVYQPSVPMYQQFIEEKRALKKTGGSESPQNLTPVPNKADGVRVPATTTTTNTMKSTSTGKRKSKEPTIDKAAALALKRTKTTAVEVKVTKAAPDVSKGSLQAFMRTRPIVPKSNSNAGPNTDLSAQH
jgi:hypothetical protein